MPERVGRADHQVIVRIAHVIGPQITGMDRQGPIGGPRHAIWTIQHPDNPVFAHGGCAVALALAPFHAAAPD